MTDKDKIPVKDNTHKMSERLKFSRALSSQIVTVTVGKARKFYLHDDILTTESEAFLKNLTGSFKEAETNAIDLDEDPELFGFFVEYVYRNRSILSRAIGHYAEYATLARMYAMEERLMAPRFQSYALWRFTESLSSDTEISDDVLCDLLQIACTEITERTSEDPMRSQIFWYGASKTQELQKCPMFQQVLSEVTDLGKHLCLWIGKAQPNRTPMPNDFQIEKFRPESEYSLQNVYANSLESEKHEQKSSNERESGYESEYV